VNDCGSIAAEWLVPCVQTHLDRRGEGPLEQRRQRKTEKVMMQRCACGWQHWEYHCEQEHGHCERRGDQEEAAPLRQLCFDLLRALIPVCRRWLLSQSVANKPLLIGNACCSAM
jgi:hypothetical protein